MVGGCVKEVVWASGSFVGVSMHWPGDLGRRCACSSQLSAGGRSLGQGKLTPFLVG